METIATGDSGSQTTQKRQKNLSGSQDPAAKSPAGSKRNLPSEKGKGGTPKAGPTPNDLEVALSILQSAFDQFLEAGGRAKLFPVPQSSILTVEIHGALKCHKCEAWTTLTNCPGCGNLIA